MDTDPDPLLLTASDVAQRLRVSTRTVWRMVRRGQFPAPLRRSRSWVRWKTSDVQGWVNQQEPAAQHKE